MDWWSQVKAKILEHWLLYCFVLIQSCFGLYHLQGERLGGGGMFRSWRGGKSIKKPLVQNLPLYRIFISTAFHTLAELHNPKGCYKIIY